MRKQNKWGKQPSVLPFGSKKVAYFITVYFWEFKLFWIFKGAKAYDGLDSYEFSRVQSNFHNHFVFLHGLDSYEFSRVQK